MLSKIGETVRRLDDTKICYGIVMKEKISLSGWKHYKIDWGDDAAEWCRRDHVHFFSPPREIGRLLNLSKRRAQYVENNL